LAGVLPKEKKTKRGGVWQKEKFSGGEKKSKRNENPVGALKGHVAERKRGESRIPFGKKGEDQKKKKEEKPPKKSKKTEKIFPCLGGKLIGRG